MVAAGKSSSLRRDMRDMTAEQRIKDAERVVAEQRAPFFEGGVLAWDDSGGSLVVLASELHRLQAAVMGEGITFDVQHV